MSRDWTPIDSDPRWDEEGYYEKVSAQCDALASRWSTISSTAEERMFLRIERDDEDWEDEDPELWNAVEAERSLTFELERLQTENIEAKLLELGARMMRPYEHHNEEERLIEWMERDR